MMLFLIAGLGLLADRAYGIPDLPDADLLSWLGVAYVSIFAATSAWLAWTSVSSKRIGMPMIALILGFWLLGLVLLIVFANITYPEWRQRISLDIFVLIAITSWIPAGLAIALPGIFSRLRHQA
jgi:hypothetical protein